VNGYIDWATVVSGWKRRAKEPHGNSARQHGRMAHEANHLRRHLGRTLHRVRIGRDGRPDQDRILAGKLMTGGAARGSTLGERGPLVEVTIPAK
jgi:hypothetical protein